MAPFDSAKLRGSRLLTLRHLEGLTQSALAERLGVSQGFISQIEKEAKPLPNEAALDACEVFGLPESFFSVAPDISEFGVATFRKSAKASVRDEQHVKALFGEAARLFRMASEHSGYREADLLDLARLEEEEAASAVRQLLDLGAQEPLPNATRALERLGVGVIHVLDPLEGSRRDHDGISRPNMVNARPLVATIGEQPPAVTRMTLVHELAHLIFDQGLTVPIHSTRSLEERRAFRFAGAVLIPAEVVQRRVTETLTLHGYLRVKADYGITVSALIKRASDLGVVSSQRARSLFIQHSSQGWRRDEPVEVAEEHPRLLSQAVRRCFGDRAVDAAAHSGVKEDLIAHWTDMPLDTSPLATVIALRRPEPRGA